MCTLSPWHQVLPLETLTDMIFRKYCIFRTIGHISPPQIWEENGGVSHSLNIAYLACWGGEVAVERGHRRQEQDHIFCFKLFFLL